MGGTFSVADAVNILSQEKDKYIGEKIARFAIGTIKYCCLLYISMYNNIVRL